VLSSGWKAWGIYKGITGFMGDARRACIIGLDGATFELLTPLMDSGDLPCLAALRGRAAWGSLESTIPPTTPPAWTTCTTGLNAGRHGVFDFTVSPLKNPDRPLISSRDAKGLRLWDAVEINMGRSVVVNVPITYPPAQMKGCMISGMMTPGFDAPFTWPPDLRDRLKAVCGNYIVNIDIPRYDTAADSDIERFIRDLRESLERRREAIRHLMHTEQWTFFMVVFIALDRIQHLFAKYLFPDNPLYSSTRAQRIRPQLIDLFKRVDSVVGEMIEQMRADDTVFVLSDHGFGVTQGFFNANTWLLKQKLLAVHTKQYLKKRVFDTCQKTAETSIIRRTIPLFIQSKIRSAIRNRRSTLHSPRLDLAAVVDWSRTKVFFSSIPAQGFYINERTEENPRGTVPSHEIDALKDHLKTVLLNVRHPGTGRRLTDSVWFREDIFHGSETSFAPHVLFCMQNYAVLGRQHLGAGSIYTDAAHQPVGFHRSDGILMVSGPSVRPGQIRANIRDIMPSVLQSMLMPIPDSLDGAIIDGLFDPDFLLKHPPVFKRYDTGSSAPLDSLNSDLGSSHTTGETEEERKTLENRLKNLGYLE
jgi:predicted AlkP superfamily phosphohydrolase/phosphomutase